MSFKGCIMAKVGLEWFCLIGFLYHSLSVYSHYFVLKLTAKNNLSFMPIG